MSIRLLAASYSNTVFSKDCVTVTIIFVKLSPGDLLVLHHYYDRSTPSSSKGFPASSPGG